MAWGTVKTTRLRAALAPDELSICHWGSPKLLMNSLLRIQLQLVDHSTDYTDAITIMSCLILFTVFPEDPSLPVLVFSFLFTSK